MIDNMLVVDPEKRFTIDQCLSHPWLTHKMPGVNDSTGGLVGGMSTLEVGRRGVARERTLLSSLNSVQVMAKVPGGGDKGPVKVFSKNRHHNLVNTGRKEVGPAHNRDAGDFMELGGRGDQHLYANEDNSVYPSADIAASRDGNGKKPRGV
jgi:serine/threonine-protein kinase CHEK2